MYVFAGNSIKYNFHFTIPTVPPNSVRISSQTSFMPEHNKSPNNLMEQDYDTSSNAISTSSASEITVKANTAEYLTCESTGSRPRAVLHWKRNGKLVTEGIITSPATAAGGAQFSNGYTYSSTISTLQIVPSVEDHNTVVSCIARSPKLPEETLEDEVSLNVLCK